MLLQLLFPKKTKGITKIGGSPMPGGWDILSSDPQRVREIEGREKREFCRLGEGSEIDAFFSLSPFFLLLWCESRTFHYLGDKLVLVGLCAKSLCFRRSTARGWNTFVCRRAISLSGDSPQGSWECGRAGRLWQKQCVSALNLIYVLCNHLL